MSDDFTPVVAKDTALAEARFVDADPPAFGNWQPCQECGAPTKHADASGAPACEAHR